VSEIRRWGTSKWAVAVWPLVAKDIPSITRTSSRSGKPLRNTTLQ
jgi:hypothetical protein